MATSKAHQKLIQQKLKEGQKFFYADPPDFARAASIFVELTRLAPNWSEGFFWLASSLLQQSQFPEAENAFRKAIALDPMDSRPHLSLGTGLERVGRLDESVRSFRAGLALKPHYGEADSRMMLASVLKKLGRIDEAVVEWKGVAKMEGMYPSYDEPINDAKRELQSHGQTV
ncbi:MAG: hypothetical protein QOJ40_3144 [Verrucomicrobiota bacterium]